MLLKVDSIPAAAKKVTKKTDTSVVLAYGEVTGHAHRISTQFAQEFNVTNQDNQTERFVDIKPGAALTHEEHSVICPEPGQYRIVQQREYAPEAIRNVAD